MNKGILIQLEPNSDFEQDILKDIQDTNLDREYKSEWTPKIVQIVQNEKLAQEFQDVKEHFTRLGYNEAEMEEHYGFVCENDNGALVNITTNGLMTQDSVHNVLGYNSLGVYVCKHADVCIQEALEKPGGRDQQTLRMAVFKFMYGKRTTAVPRVSNATEFIRPTPNFDCHISALPSFPHDTLQAKADKAQVYLFEMDSQRKPVRRPRLCMPYCVVSLSRHSQIVSPVVSTLPQAQPINAQLAENPALQEIVNAINARPEAKIGGPFVNASTPPVSPLAVGIPDQALQLGTVSPKLAGAPVRPGVPMLAKPPGMPIIPGQVLHPPGADGLLGCPPGLPPIMNGHQPAPAATPPLRPQVVFPGGPRGIMENPRLKHIVDQINAKPWAKPWTVAKRGSPPMKPDANGLEMRPPAPGSPYRPASPQASILGQPGHNVAAAAAVNYTGRSLTIPATTQSIQPSSLQQLMPGIPTMTGLQTLPSLQGIPGVPSLQQSLAGLPQGYAGMQQVPGIQGMQQVQGMQPGLTGVQGLGGVPTIPAMPGVQGLSAGGLGTLQGITPMQAYSQAQSLGMLSQQAQQPFMKFIDTPAGQPAVQSQLDLLGLPSQLACAPSLATNPGLLGARPLELSTMSTALQAQATHDAGRYGKRSFYDMDFTQEMAKRLRKF
ncbi:unnamed protein product [Owenia fusiformis]|uniref:TASOR pseudo-PARP domain-containing protein n=1 Tax=Owenia fusiformis TaxID=6347 RepID=A0A8J1UXB4_OWEFU|nr:unnamed protein product [Owenia fusiformis]